MGVKPLIVQVFITDNCDQRCKHCYIYGSNPELKPDSMSFQTFEHVLKEGRAYTDNTGIPVHYSFAGGDPLLHPDFWEFAERLKENGHKFNMIGNPFHLTPKVCQRLREVGCTRYEMSLDGLKESHDNNRREGSFDATLSSLKMIHEAGLSSGIRCCVSQDNIADIPELIDLCVRYRVSDFAFSRYSPTGERKNTIEPLEYRKLLDTCYKKFEEYRKNGCWTYFYEMDHLFTLYKYEEGLLKLPETGNGQHIRYGCSCGKKLKKLRVLPDGTVMACRRVKDSILGNIMTDSLETLLLQKKCYSDLSLYEGCSRCILAPYCRGCPGVASGQTGNFFARDPQCWHIVE